VHGRELPGRRTELHLIGARIDRLFIGLPGDDDLVALTERAEIARLEKDLAVAAKEIVDTAAKLANDSFMGKAPAPVVDKIRARAAKAAADVDRLTRRLGELKGGTA